MVFTTDGFFEVAIESWPEWDLDPRPLNSVRTQSQLCTATPISSFVQCHISFRLFAFIILFTASSVLGYEKFTALMFTYSVRCKIR